MTTLGDVFLILGGLFAIGIACWAALVLSAIAFPNRAAKGAHALSNKTGGTFFLGFMVFAPATFIGLVLASLPSPAAKILGFLIFLALLLVALLGAGGMVRFVSEKLKASAGDVSQYGSVTRASGLLVAACNIPFLGWFLLAPLMVIGSVGSYFGGLKQTVAPEVNQA
ncbi:MAG: hypothetical protein KDC26_02295 [Armatimonadetes bacterium]|nr:hypothetical protein [Armatimonadota bacterium]